MSEDDILYLVDGSGFVFRAYYGLRAPMTALDGTPTNAVFGFTRLLMNLMRDRKPSHLAVAFDPPGLTFRNGIYPEYKANRIERPPDLLAQFPLCREAVTALGIPVVATDGFEADDVIGTLARRFADRGHKVLIVTADKDFMQLVGPHIALWDGRDKEIDRDAVIEKFGVPPERVVDVLGLAGDSSDNIPGVPGIGPKTATKLLQEFGDLDTLLANAGSIKGKRGESLVAFGDQARLSRRLATIREDVPLELDEAALTVTPPDPEVLGAFWRRLDFRQFLGELGELTPVAQEELALEHAEYRTVLDLAGLDAVLASARAAGQLALELWTTDEKSHRADLVGVALAWAPGKAAYVPLRHQYLGVPAQLETTDVLARLQPLLADPAVRIAGQNTKRERQVLRRLGGIEIAGVDGDVLIAVGMVEPDRRNMQLDRLVTDFLGRKAAHAAPSGSKAPPQHALDVETATARAAETADVVLRLAHVLGNRLEAEGSAAVYRDIELPLADVVGRMEARGIRIDPARLHAQSERFAVLILALTTEIHRAADGAFNIDSPKQLGQVLFERLGLPVGKKKQTGYSTDQSVLETLSPRHPLPGLVLRYRQLTKLRNTYLETLPKMIDPETGRVHTSFHQTGAATGRLSSSNPNLQNIPVRTPEGREIRRAFIAADGWKLISADYSQVELRLLAHYSEDPGLIESFADGADIHRRTAAEVFGVPEPLVTPEQRTQAKAVNFGLMYGMSAFRLANDLGIERGAARAMVDRYFARYAGVKRYFEAAVEDARATRHSRTLFGRTRPLPHIHSDDRTLRAQAERLAVNTPIQGSAADILKKAMVSLDRRLAAEGLAARMLLTVHDELVVEVPHAELGRVPEIVREEMEGAATLRVPLRVDLGVGDDWAEIH